MRILENFTNFLFTVLIVMAVYHGFVSSLRIVPEDDCDSYLIFSKKHRQWIQVYQECK